MERVRRLVGAKDLPARHRRASLPRLFDAGAEGAADRYAEVDCPRPDTFLDMGEDVDVRRVPPGAVEDVPAVLRTTARRWGWAGVLHDGPGFRIVVDVAWLASLAAPRGPA
jgi:hypothetical protein